MPSLTKILTCLLYTSKKYAELQKDYVKLHLVEKEVIKEVVREVPKEVVKEVIKEVPSAAEVATGISLQEYAPSSMPCGTL